MVANYWITSIITIVLSLFHGLAQPLSCRGSNGWTSSSRRQSRQTVSNASSESTPINIKRIEIEGNEVFPDDFSEFNHVKQKYIGKARLACLLLLLGPTRTIPEIRTCSEP